MNKKKPHRTVTANTVAASGNPANLGNEKQ